MQNETENQMTRALKEFGFTISVPLFSAKDEDADHLGTGTFIKKGHKLVLLTARHLLDECDPKDIAISDSYAGSSLFTLGNLIVHQPKDITNTEVDVVGIEICDQSMIDRIESGWRIVDTSIGDHQNIKADKILIGYPTSQFDKEGYSIAGKPIAFTCTPKSTIPTKAKEPVNQGLDLFLEYPRKALELGDNFIDVENIKGMSGSAIWELRALPDEEVWSPEKVLRLIGIQSSAAKNQFVRGKKWSYVCKVLEAV